MKADYYDAATEPEDTTGGAVPIPEKAEGPETGEEEAGGQSALIPLSAFGGDATPGQTFTGKIVHVYEDEAEVELTLGGETPSEMPMESAMSQLEDMSEEA